MRRGWPSHVVLCCPSPFRRSVCVPACLLSILKHKATQKTPQPNSLDSTKFSWRPLLHGPPIRRATSTRMDHRLKFDPGTNGARSRILFFCFNRSRRRRSVRMPTEKRPHDRKTQAPRLVIQRRHLDPRTEQAQGAAGRHRNRASKSQVPRRSKLWAAGTRRPTRQQGANNQQTMKMEVSAQSRTEATRRASAQGAVGCGNTSLCIAFAYLVAHEKNL